MRVSIVCLVAADELFQAFVDKARHDASQLAVSIGVEADEAFITTFTERRIIEESYLEPEPTPECEEGLGLKHVRSVEVPDLRREIDEEMEGLYSLGATTSMALKEDKYVRSILEAEYGRLYYAGGIITRIDSEPRPNNLNKSHVYDTPHVDKNNVPRYEISSLLYLSTHGVDFDGGELEFCDDVIYPKFGQLVFFTSDLRHRVRRVTRGTRYVLAMWFTSEPAHALF